MGSHISYLKETAGWSSLSEEEDRMKIVEDLSVDSENVMTAVVYKHHGSVDDCLEIAIVNRPKPLPGQILVKVHAYGINKADTKLLENPGNEFEIFLPKIIGSDFSGTVVKDIGEELKVGDKVTGLFPYGKSSWGCAAEYVAIEEKMCTKIHTDNMDLIEAAGVPSPGLAVYQAFQPFLQQISEGNNVPTSSIGANTATISSTQANTHTGGMRVLIVNGCGNSGTLAIQYCKKVLGMHVTTITKSGNIDFLKNLGADAVIEGTVYNRGEDFQPVDVVYDNSYLSLREIELPKLIREGGWHLKYPEFTAVTMSQQNKLEKIMHNAKSSPLRFVADLISQQTTFILGLMKRFLLPSEASTKAFYQHSTISPSSSEDLNIVLDLMATKNMRIVVDKVFPLQLDKVKEGHNFVATDSNCGKIIVRIQPQTIGSSM